MKRTVKSEKDDNFDNQNGHLLNSRNDASSSKVGRNGHRKRYLRPGEEGSRYFVLHDPTRPTNQDHPVRPTTVDTPNENQKRRVVEENASNIVQRGQKFVGVIDGVCPGGYMMSMRIGNSDGPVVRGVLTKPDSNVNVICHANNNAGVGVPLVPNTRNEEKCVMIDLNETPEMDEESFSKPSIEVQPKSPSTYSGKSGAYVVPLSAVPLSVVPFLSTTKVVPVVLKPVTLSSLEKGKGVSSDYNPTGYENYYRDPWLPINYPSPAMSMGPPDLETGTSVTPTMGITTPPSLARGKGVVIEKIQQIDDHGGRN